MRKFLWFLFHAFMTVITSGIWLIVLLIWWFVTRNKR